MLRITFLFVIIAIVAGCSSAETKNSKVSVTENKNVEKNELTARGGKLEFDPKVYVVKKYDINKDKKPDIINVFKKTPSESGKKGDFDLQISVKMMDLNRDSKIDVWRYFDENGAVTKEELDLDYDGKIDTVDYYLNGVVRKREISFQFDNKVDIWRNYDEKGELILLEADQNGNGKPDFWEYYNKGVIERIEKDTDGDGKPDIFKRSGDKDFTRIVNTSEKFEGGSQQAIEEKPEDELPSEENTIIEEKASEEKIQDNSAVEH